MTEEEIFDAALQLPPSERKAYAEFACAGDSQLLESVEQLLQFHNEVDDFMARPAIEALIDAPASLETEQQIGPYTLQEVLGQGGMGIVYRATQSQPVVREVAIKVIKPGLDTAEVISRFRSEQRTLAVMDHPYIAKVLEAGVTESGRPYFVMERVHGVPITEFCEQKKLAAEERLSLFIDVCMAVQHAHSKSIIHRDIKPTNVLVTLQDGRPVPKIIDFGIAKALDRDASDYTIVTQHSQVLGTPLYMSPEQASANAIDLDTRTDIYSLGVLLYELLTGCTPFDRQRMHAASFDEVRRIIREEEPPKPSTMIDTQSNRSSSLSTHRGTDARRLSRRLKGDLDWIVMKALEKDRERRYETASDFASDVRRFLNYEAVLASPPSNIYRLKRTLWRYRVVVSVTVAMLGLSLLGTAGTAYGLLKSQIANRELTQSLVNEARERAEAVRQQEIAEAVVAFLNDDLLAAVAPSVELGKGQDVQMREVLDAAAQRIDAAAQEGGKFFDKPQVESRIRSVIGQTYLALNLPQQAQAQLERAQKLSADPPSSSSSDSLSVDIMIAQYQVYAEIGKLAEAEDMARRVVEIRLKNNAADSEPVMSAKHFLAHLLFRSGKYAESRDLFDENLKYRIKSFGEDSKNALRTQASVAACHVKLNEYAVAEKLYESLLPKARATKDTFVLAYVLGSLAEIRVQQQRLDEAQVLIDEAMTLNDKLFGADHTESIGLVGQSAILAAKRQDWPKALQRFQKVYDSNLRINGPVGISTVSARHNLAVAYYKIKELDKGEAVIKDQLKEATAALGDDNLWIRRTYNLIGLIGDAYSEQGQTEDGLRMQRLVLRHILAITEMPEPKPADLHRAAVFLADTKHSELRNLPRALEFIERAVRLQSTTQEPKVEIFEKDLNRIRGLKQSSLD